MKDFLENHIRGKVENPSLKEIDEILELFQPKYFKRNELIKKPFTLSKEFMFLVEGAVRSVYFKENGEEITYKIHEANSFITDIMSYRANKVTPIGFRCIKKSSLLVASQDRIQDLLKTNLVFNIVLRETITEKIVEVGNSYLLFLTGNSKERYQFFLKKYPDFFTKFPLKFIASLIGVTPTQLSRLRNKNPK